MCVGISVGLACSARCYDCLIGSEFVLCQVKSRYLMRFFEEVWGRVHAVQCINIHIMQNLPFYMLTSRFPTAIRRYEDVYFYFTIWIVEWKFWGSNAIGWLWSREKWTCNLMSRWILVHSMKPLTWKLGRSFVKCQALPILQSTNRAELFDTLSRLMSEASSCPYFNLKD